MVAALVGAVEVGDLEVPVLQPVTVSAVPVQFILVWVLLARQIQVSAVGRVQPTLDQALGVLVLLILVIRGCLVLVLHILA